MYNFEIGNDYIMQMHGMLGFDTILFFCIKLYGITSAFNTKAIIVAFWSDFWVLLSFIYKAICIMRSRKNFKYPQNKTQNMHSIKSLMTGCYLWRFSLIWNGRLWMQYWIRTLEFWIFIFSCWYKIFGHWMSCGDYLHK